MCPTDTFACDENVFNGNTVTVDEVLADPEHPANFVICADRPEFCPITNMSILFDPIQENFVIQTTKKATNFPLLSFKISPE